MKVIIYDVSGKGSISYSHIHRFIYNTIFSVCERCLEAYSYEVPLLLLHASEEGSNEKRTNFGIMK